MADIDHVLDSIRSMQALDAAAEALRSTAPILAATLGDLTRKVRAGAWGFVPDLTEREWEAAAEECQARHRPPVDPPPARPAAHWNEETNDGGPRSVPNPG
jgi:hypothetical protein